MTQLKFQLFLKTETNPKTINKGLFHKPLNNNKTKFQQQAKIRITIITNQVD